MDKFSVIIALTSVLIGFASANKIGLEEEFVEPHLHHHHGLGGGLGGGGLGGGGFGGGIRGPLGHLRDEELLEEIRFRGLHHGGGLGGLGGGFGGFPGRFGGRPRFNNRRKPLLGVGGGGLGGVGGGAAGGAAGAVSNLDSIGTSSHLGSHNLAEGSQGALVGTKNDFDVGGHVKLINEDEGTHRHNVINSNKILIKDSTTGVSDEDSFRKVNGISKGGHLSSSKGKIAAEATSGRLENDKEADTEFDRVHANSAEGAVGAGIAEGAIGGAGGGIF